MTREIPRQAFICGALGSAVAGALSGSCRATAPDPQAPPAEKYDPDGLMYSGM
jgi:hypothetical protein